MAKVLIVRKPDRTIHQMPLANKGVIMAYSNRLPASQQYKFEEVDEAEAAKLPYIDTDYVTAVDAQDKIKAKDKELAAKDAKLKELEEKLASMNHSSTAKPNTDEELAETETQGKKSKK